MKTMYAGGRASFPAPTITVAATGSIAGASGVYYFWTKGQNRAGFNTPSAVRTINIPNNGRLTIAASAFTPLAYEDWHYIHLYVSRTNDFTTARCLYSYSRYQADQLTINVPVDVVITSNADINTANSITDETLLPASPPEGYRIQVMSKSAVYTYRAGSLVQANGISVLAPVSGPGRWHITSSLVDTAEGYLTELSLVNAPLTAPVENATQPVVPVMYYILNDGGGSVTGFLEINPYASQEMTVEYRFKIHGHINLTNFAFDSTGFQYTDVTVFEDNLSIGKALPVGRALIVSIYPFILNNAISYGSYLTVYPKISPFVVQTAPLYFDAPVATLAALMALPPTAYLDGQSRIVMSNRALYTFYADSTAVANGSDILMPAGNPATGRWMSASSSLGSETVGLAQLKPEVIDALEDDSKVTSVTLTTTAPYTIDLDTGFDYFILDCPVDNGNTLIFNVSGTLANNDIKSCIIELRQNTAAVEFHSTITFPGGNAPVLSGAGKTDMLVLTLVKDSTGAVRKRGTISRSDIG